MFYNESIVVIVVVVIMFTNQNETLQTEDASWLIWRGEDMLANINPK